MTSKARRNFLEGISGMTEACDLGAVRSDGVAGQFLRKGLTVASFNALEGFMAERSRELAAYLNAQHVHFRDLPEPVRKKILLRTVEVTAGEVKRLNFTADELQDYLREAGDALSKTSSGLALSSAAVRWPNSNAGENDIAYALKLFGVESPWSAMTAVTADFGFPKKNYAGEDVDLQQEFRRFSKLRNQAAHEAGGDISVIQLRTIPDLVKRLGFGFDVLASIAVVHVGNGDPGYLAGNSVVGASTFDFHVIQDRGNGFAHYKGAPSGRARRVAKNGGELFDQVCTGATPGELVVKSDQSRRVLDWAVAGSG